MDKNVLDAFQRQRQRMQMSHRYVAPRQRHINFLTGDLIGKGLGLKFLILFSNEFFNLRFGLVDDFADLRPILFGQRSHAAKDRRKLAFFPQEPDANIIEFAETRCLLLNQFSSLLPELCNLLFHQ